MKLDELFERLRPVGASREDFQAGSKFETLLSNLESKLEKAMQFSMEKDEDLYPIFEEQRQALQEVARNLANLRKNKDEDSVTALKESLAIEAKTSKIARKIISDRPDEDKLKFDSNLEASMIIKSSQEQLNQLMSEIDSFREITKENKDLVVELSKTFKEITSDLNKDNKLGAAATAIAPITKKFDVGDKSERIEESISVIDESDDKDLDLGSGKNSKSELQSIRELLEKKLYETKTQESNLLLENLNLTKKEERNEEGSEERVSDNIIIKKLDEFSDELDALDMRDGEFQLVEGEVDNTKTSTEVDLKEPDFEIKEVESDRNVDSIERANADSETYLSELSEDQTYKQDIASIREDVSKILALMGEGASSEESDSEEDSDSKLKSSGGGFSLGSMFGFGKMKEFISGLGPLLSKLGLAAGAIGATAWAGNEIYNSIKESKKASEGLGRSVSEREQERRKELEDLEKNDEENVISQIKKKNKEIYGVEEPTEEDYIEYEKSQDNILQRTLTSDEVYESRASRRKDRIIRDAANLAKYGTENPNSAMIEDYDEMKFQTKRLGISKDEWYRVKDYLTHPSDEAYGNLSDVEKKAVSDFKMKGMKSERALKDNELLIERDNLIKKLVSEGREDNEDTRNYAIEQIKKSNYITESQLNMLNSTPYGVRITKPIGINPRLEKDEWALNIKESYRRAGITNEETLNALVAQDAHESNWGKSSQSREFNNFGNIHAGGYWKGKTSEGSDTHADGSKYKTNFRVYDDIDEYTKDKVKFLKTLYDFDENDPLEVILEKLQGGNKAGRSYAESPVYKEAIANIYYGTANKTYYEDSNVLNEARLLEWSKKLPNLNPTQYRGGFKDGVWLDNKDYSQFESGDIVSFKENKVLPSMLGYVGNMNSDGSYESITVNSETLEPVRIEDGKSYDISGNEIPSSSLRVVKVDSPEYDEILRRQLKKKEYVNEEKGDSSTWAKNQFGDETNLTIKDQKAFYNSAISAAKNSKGMTVKEAQLKAREFSNINKGISSGKGDFIQLPVGEAEKGEFDLSKINLGGEDRKNYSALDLNYTQNDDWVVDMSTLNGGNVIKAEPLDDLRGEYKTDENRNRYLDRGYEGEPNLDIRSDMTKSIQSGVKKATSKLSDWFTFQKKAKVQESQSIDMNRVASIEKDIEDAAVKKIEVVQGAKPSLPALKPIEVKEKKEEKKILDKKQPTSTVITNITTFNSVDSLMRDDIGNIGTA